MKMFLALIQIMFANLRRLFTAWSKLLKLGMVKLPNTCNLIRVCLLIQILVCFLTSTGSYM